MKDYYNGSGYVDKPCYNAIKAVSKRKRSEHGGIDNDKI